MENRKDMENSEYLVFEGPALLAKGSLADLAQLEHIRLRPQPGAMMLFFDSKSGRQVDLDLTGTLTDTAAAGGKPGVMTETGAGGKPRGRPRLGVVGREITLLPRHWQWLDQQRGGASAALRRLIDESRKERAADDAIREAQDSANRFMMAMAGDLPRFEEAVRALYARDGAKFREETQRWPADIRRCAGEYAEAAFA